MCSLLSVICANGKGCFLTSNACLFHRKQLTNRPGVGSVKSAITSLAKKQSWLRVGSNMPVTCDHWKQSKAFVASSKSTCWTSKAYTSVNGEKWLFKVPSKRNHCVYKVGNHNSIFAKASYVWVKEHVFVKNTGDIPPHGMSSCWEIKKAEY